jgi:hypothetical protein
MGKFDVAGLEFKTANFPGLEAEITANEAFMVAFVGGHADLLNIENAIVRLNGLLTKRAAVLLSIADAIVAKLAAAGTTIQVDIDSHGVWAGLGNHPFTKGQFDAFVADYERVYDVAAAAGASGIAVPGPAGTVGFGEGNLRMGGYFLEIQRKNLFDNAELDHAADFVGRLNPDLNLMTGAVATVLTQGAGPDHDLPNANQTIKWYKERAKQIAHVEIPNIKRLLELLKDLHDNLKYLPGEMWTTDLKAELLALSRMPSNDLAGARGQAIFGQLADAIADETEEMQDLAEMFGVTVTGPGDPTYKRIYDDLYNRVLTYHTELTTMTGQHGAAQTACNLATGNARVANAKVASLQAEVDSLKAKGGTDTTALVTATAALAAAKADADKKQADLTKAQKTVAVLTALLKKNKIPVPGTKAPVKKPAPKKPAPKKPVK